jgi:hypothetical protein|tara:strand:- start:66 stop:194 length:129 start_codon:yes stop_codon:yes gene_type:complete
MFRVRIIVDDSIEIYTFDTEEDANDFKENRLDQGSVFLIDEV